MVDYTTPWTRQYNTRHHTQGYRTWQSLHVALSKKMSSVGQIQVWKYGKICQNTYNYNIVRQSWTVYVQPFNGWTDSKCLTVRWLDGEFPNCLIIGRWISQLPNDWTALFQLPNEWTSLFQLSKPSKVYNQQFSVKTVHVQLSKGLF